MRATRRHLWPSDDFMVLPEAVDLLALDYAEALALRGVLEYIGTRVNLFTVGRATHVVAALNAEAPHLVICCHGDDQGIVLPQLSRRAVPDDPFYKRLRPADVARHGRLGGRVVLTTGCDTGSDAFAEAFLGAGASAFIGPVGYPQDALFFLVHVYYQLQAGRDLDNAVQSVHDHDVAGCDLFRIVWNKAVGGGKGMRADG